MPTRQVVHVTRSVQGAGMALLTALAGWAIAETVVPETAGVHAERPPTPCHASCTALKSLVAGNVSCDVETYPYDWNNKICEGILPRCIVSPRDAQDVSATVKYAAANNANLSYRSGGHSYTCNGIKSDSIHMDLRSLNSVERRVNATSGRVELVFGPGNTMKRLIDALEGDEMIIHGQCPSVGAGGLFLHGGWHTTLTLKHGTGNATVTRMEVVTADGKLVELSPTSAHQDLWRAMRKAGSSFGIATSITVEPFTDVPLATTPIDGGEMFSLAMPRSQLLRLTFNASREAGLTTYFHINGIDVLAVSASKKWGDNRAWLEGRIGRKLSLKEVMRSELMRLAVPEISKGEGAGGKFGTSGEMPYVVSSALAYATVSFTVPLSCFTSPRVQQLLAELPNHRDNTTELGCYLQVTTTYKEGFVCIDFNCMYDSAYYQQLQRTLNQEILAACPGDVERYVNTPSAFLTARDYFRDYDELAAIKSSWDPSEVFRVYQGVRPTGVPPDAYEWKRDYVRKNTAIDWARQKLWKFLVRYFFD